MIYLLTANDDITVWNMFQQKHIVKKGDKLRATKSKIKNNDVYTINILDVPTLFDSIDVNKYFNIEELSDA